MPYIVVNNRSGWIHETVCVFPCIFVLIWHMLLIYNRSREIYNFVWALSRCMSRSVVTFWRVCFDDQNSRSRIWLHRMYFISYGSRKFYCLIDLYLNGLYYLFLFLGWDVGLFHPSYLFLKSLSVEPTLVDSSPNLGVALYR